MPDNELHTNADGDFVVVSTTPNLAIKVVGYTPQPITEEQAERIKSDIEVLGRENLMYNEENNTVEEDKNGNIIR